MNLLETIYCSQYYELKKTGRDPLKARVNGTLLCATVILLALVPIGVIVNRIAPHLLPAHWFRGLLSDGVPARSVGKILGFIALVIVGGLLHLTIGSKRNYQKMMDEWEFTSEDVLQHTIKKSLKIFGIVFAVFLLTIFSSFL